MKIFPKNKKFTIPTKDFSNNRGSIFRVNKFGVHHIMTINTQDTGYGFCVHQQDFKTYSHEYFLKEFTKNDEIIDYINNNLTEYDDTIKTKLHVKILNYGYPYIYLSKNSKLVIDDKILWDGHINKVPHKDHKFDDNMPPIPNNLKIYPQLHDLGVFDIPANQHLFFDS